MPILLIYRPKRERDYYWPRAFKAYRYRKMMTPVYEQYLWLLDFICNSENKFKNAQIALALDSRMEGIREKITIKDFEKEALKRGIKVFPVHTRQAEKKGQDLFCATLVRRKGVYISLSSDENEGIGYLKIHWLRRVNEEGKADSLGSSPLFRREIEKGGSCPPRS